MYALRVTLRERPLRRPRHIRSFKTVSFHIALDLWFVYHIVESIHYSIPISYFPVRQDGQTAKLTLFSVHSRAHSLDKQKKYVMSR